MKSEEEIRNRIEDLKKEAAKTAVNRSPIFEKMQISELKWVLGD